MILVVCKPYNDMIMAKLDKKQQKLTDRNLICYYISVKGQKCPIKETK